MLLNYIYLFVVSFVIGLITISYLYMINPINIFHSLASILSISLISNYISENIISILEHELVN